MLTRRLVLAFEKLEGVQLEDRQVKANGINLHVIEAGRADGPPVILLHGFPDFWYGWKNQIPYLAKAGYRVIVPDQRGYNLSDKPAAVKDYQIDSLTQDIIGLMAALGIVKANVVGHDWGAAVAWWLATYYPEKVNKLVILNVPHPFTMMDSLRKNFAQLRKSWYMFFFQIPRLPEWSISLRNWKSGVDQLRISSNPGAFSEEDFTRYREAWSKPGAMTGMMNWYRAIMRYAPAKKARTEVNVPTLILWGVKDKFLGRELVPPSLALCRQGEAVYLENSTHWLLRDEPEKVNRLIEEFLIKE